MTTMRSSVRQALSVTVLGLALTLSWSGCGPSVGSQTNWLRACDGDGQCGEGLRCLCGTCTLECEDAAACGRLANAACVPADDPGAVALCGGHASLRPGLCLPRCQDEACPAGTACVAGVCSQLPEPTVRVSVDTETRFQTLVGFGAGLAYMDDEISRHPRRAEIYEAMFAGAGTDVLRLRNRHGHDADITSSGEIVRAAEESLGRRPTVLMTSASPPAALKQNGATQCGGNEDTCTLRTLPEGGFDYEGLAAHWRASLEAYAELGVEPDSIAVQNNPNWVPSASAPMEACRFLPTEGVVTLTVDGSEVEVNLPGLAQATAAVRGALEGLAAPPSIVAPETSGMRGVASYAPHVEWAEVGAIGYHMYDIDAAAVDEEALLELAAFGRQLGLPIFQTEMQANGFDTAVLMHHALAVVGASAYLQNDFASSASLTPNPTALIALTEEEFVLQTPYHALRHFAFSTDPGWIRVGAASDVESLLATAWLSPAADRLTVILVNAGATELVVELESTWQAPPRVVRTVFEGSERSTELGSLPAEGIVRVPGRSIVTVATR